MLIQKGMNVCRCPHLSCAGGAGLGGAGSAGRRCLGAVAGGREGALGPLCIRLDTGSGTAGNLGSTGCWHPWHGPGNRSDWSTVWLGSARRGPSPASRWPNVNDPLAHRWRGSRHIGLVVRLLQRLSRQSQPPPATRCRACVARRGGWIPWKDRWTRRISWISPKPCTSRCPRRQPSHGCSCGGRRTATGGWRRWPELPARGAARSCCARRRRCPDR
jgi:hypothetical protein